MIDFDGQVAIVTGAGRGLGRHYALEFARRGAAVVVNDLGGATTGDGSDANVASEVVAEIEAAGGKAVASCDSVATERGGKAIIETAMDTYGRVDAVIHNAGILTNAMFEDITAEQWRDMLSVHLDGGFYLSQPAYRVMKQQQYGRFVFTSSSAAMFGAPAHAHYAAAKTGLFGLKNVIAIEGKRHGILANNILPYGLTRMMVHSSGGEERAAQLPMLQIFKSEDVVPMVVYLASSACSVSHEDYSAAAGRYARVFTSVGEGWAAEASSCPSADDIAEHFEQVASTDNAYVPFSTSDETVEISTRRGIDLSGVGWN